MIENTVNNKKYIGQAGDIKYRWIKHKSELRCGRHSNRHLQSAWNRYGQDCFVFSVIETVPFELLDKREQYWISHFDTYNTGYNLDLGGKGCRGYKHTEEEISKMRRIQAPHIVLQFDLDFNFVKEWIGGIAHIRKVLGYTKECIALRCEHTIKKEMTPYKDSYWIYKEEYEHPDFSWDKYLNNEAILDFLKENATKQRRIIQYDLNGNIIKKWNSFEEIRPMFRSYRIILDVLSHRRKRAFDCIWAYEDEQLTDEYFNTVRDYYEKKNRKTPIKCMDPITMNVVNTFCSISEGAKYYSIDPSNISVAIKKYPNYKSAGFLWKRL